MKHHFCKLAALVCCVAVPQICPAQAIILTENIGTVSVGTSAPTARTYSGFQNSGIGSIVFSAPTGNITTVRDNSNSSTVFDYPEASGGNHVYFSGNTASYLSIGNIATNGVTGIRIGFGVSKSTVAENGSNLLVHVMVGNSSVSFSPDLPMGAGTTRWYYVEKTLTIPKGPLMTLLFVNNSVSPGTVAYRVDDIIVLSEKPLPVHFGAISARERSGSIFVDWVTLEEDNNSYFEIEASVNGVDFKPIKVIPSLKNNSAGPEHYQAIIETEQLSSLLGLSFLSLLLVPVLGWYFKRQYLAGIAIFFLMLSCTKTGLPDAVPGSRQLFIRVKQVDRDDVQRYSRVVRVLRE